MASFVVIATLFYAAGLFAALLFGSLRLVRMIATGAPLLLLWGGILIVGGMRGGNVDMTAALSGFFPFLVGFGIWWLAVHSRRRRRQRAAALR